MYKTASRKQQFLTRTGSSSTVGMRDLQDILHQGIQEELSQDQQRAAVAAALNGVIAQLVDIKERMRPKLSFDEARRLKMEREALVARQGELQAKLATMKQERRKENVGHFIIEVMRERLTKPEWEMVVAEAHRRHAAQTPEEGIGK
jgi:hypothetical protein